MFEPSILLAYILASIAIVVVPGPSVTLIIANSLSAGSRAGLANVAGTQAGLLLLVIILALGLETIVENLSYVFTYLKIAGALYLIWLGIKLLRSDGKLGEAKANMPEKSLSAYFIEGFFVICANPKVLFFFGAFIPQFVDPSGNAGLQTMVLGLIFMVVATVFDSAYALAAGKTGNLLSRSRIRTLECFSGLCLIGGGLWLAFSKRTV